MKLLIIKNFCNYLEYPKLQYEPSSVYTHKVYYHYQVGEETISEGNTSQTDASVSSESANNKTETTSQSSDSTKTENTGMFFLVL